MAYLFFQEDFDGLLGRIANIKEKIKQQYEAIAESTDQSSETWHDNYGYEDGMRQVAMLIEEMQRLEAVKAGAEIIVPGNGNDTVDIGSRVLVEDTEDGSRNELVIGSYLSLFAGEEVISYSSPLAQVLMGGKADEIRTGQIGSKERSFRILRIS